MNLHCSKRHKAKFLHINLAQANLMDPSSTPTRPKVALNYVSNGHKAQKLQHMRASSHPNVAMTLKERKGTQGTRSGPCG